MGKPVPYREKNSRGYVDTWMCVWRWLWWGPKTDGWLMSTLWALLRRPSRYEIERI